MRNRAVRGVGAVRRSHPFNHQTSLALDMALIALETAPSWNRRTWARFCKRWYEHRVPPFKGG